MIPNIDQLQEECDGFLPSVCWAMIAERLRHDGADRPAHRSERPKRVAPPVPSPATRKRVLKAYGSRCVYCSGGAEVDLDFLVPHCREGTARPENLVPACAPCRDDRGTKHLDIWFGLRLDLDDHAIYSRIQRGTCRMLHVPAELRRAA